MLKDYFLLTLLKYRQDCPKHSDTSFSREWKINMANKKKNIKKL